MGCFVLFQLREAPCPGTESSPVFRFWFLDDVTHCSCPFTVYLPSGSRIRSSDVSVLVSWPVEQWLASDDWKVPFSWVDGMDGWIGGMDARFADHYRKGRDHSCLFPRRGGDRYMALYGTKDEWVGVNGSALLGWDGGVPLNHSPTISFCSPKPLTTWTFVSPCKVDFSWQTPINMLELQSISFSIPDMNYITIWDFSARVLQTQ